MPEAQLAIAWERNSAVITEWSSLEDDTQNQEEIVLTDDLRDDRVFGELVNAVNEARRILDLGDDWDGEGSLAISQDTFDRAVEFLTKQADWVWSSFGTRLSVPIIGPGPNGSIDLHWKQPGWELLINIPADTNELASFYGDNYGAQKIKGSFDTKTENLGIAAWLMN